MNKTPDQIRPATVPVKRTALSNGLLGLALGAVVFGGSWALLHPEQARAYPGYVSCSHKASGKARAGMSAKAAAARQVALLRYALLRYGNEGHRFDADIVRQGWYPAGERSPATWVRANAAGAPVYSQSALWVIRWPLLLSAALALAGSVWGCIVDARYRSSILSGVPLDGSVIGTVAQYNKEIKGDGMKYAVKAWRDR
jgi:hypothetical protein